MKAGYALILAAVLLGCTKPSTDKPGGEILVPPEAPKAIAAYCFEGDSTLLYHAYMLDMEVSYAFAFTGVQGETVNVGLRKELIGRQINPAEFYHNDDYLFRLETEEILYSQYHALKGGSFLISSVQDGEWKISLDLSLADGSSFRLEYEGPVENTSEDED